MVKLFHMISNNLYSVSKMRNVEVIPRLFCIFDKDLTHELKFEYKDPHITTNIMPVLGAHSSIGFYDNEKTYRHYSYRMTEKDALRHYEEICRKKDIIQQIQLEEEKKFMENYYKSKN